LDLSRRLFEEESPDNMQMVAPLIAPPLDLTDDVEADKRDVDITLTEMREQTILQNLLHKNLTEKNLRAMTLEHKNDRKLRLFVPPDCESTKAFVEEAKQSHWIQLVTCFTVKFNVKVCSCAWPKPSQKIVQKLPRKESCVSHPRH